MLLHIGCEYAIYALCINLLSCLSLCLYYAEYLTTPTPVLLPEYDYIIVGSGTAGSLIAHRLATETPHTYVLLEAGAPGNLFTDVPVLGPLLQRSVYDWGYETVPQDKACLTMVDKKCKWPRGKVVGGSAIMNNMIHLRGNLSHYVDWFHGRYNRKYIEKQFQYIEHNILHIKEIKYTSKLADAILDAATEMGYRMQDLNKEFNLGFMKSPVNQRDGSRWSTSHTLRRDKHNLVSNILVEKILINDRKVAYGVEYIQNGIYGKIKARKGVILAAGSIDTPKLLLLTGIGPEEHLIKVGIPLVNDLSVGKNLQDHVTTGFDLILFNQSLGLSPWDMINPINAAYYIFYGQGPFTSTGCEVIGILSTNVTDSADLQFMVLPVGLTSDKGADLRKSFRIRREVWNEYFAKIFHKQTASILPILLHPKSRGDVKLRSDNPKDPPLINPRYLTEKEDVDILVRGLEILKEFVNTESMKKLGAYMNPNPYPNCEYFKLFSKEYWECYIRELTLTSFHPIGTCKMGARDSPSSVVDTSFEVIGVNQLYVADGSVLPTLPSGNVNAAIALMANIFFESHFLRLKRASEINVCPKVDRMHNFYMKTCSMV